MRLSINISGFYALLIVLLAGFLVFFSILAVQISHYFDDTPDVDPLSLVISVVLSTVFLLTSAVAIIRLRKKNLDGIDVTLDLGRSQRTIAFTIMGKNFTLQFQFPIALANWVITLGDASADEITWVGWVTLALGILSFITFIYSIYRLIRQYRYPQLNEGGKR